MERRRRHIEVGELRIEQTKAVVMLGGDDDVFHTCFLSRPDPGIGIKLDRIKLREKLIVLLDGNMCRVANPFTVSGLILPFSGRDRIESPMNEQTESSFVPPFHTGGKVGLRFLDSAGWCLRLGSCDQEAKREPDEEFSTTHLKTDSIRSATGCSALNLRPSSDAMVWANCL